MTFLHSTGAFNVTKTPQTIPLYHPGLCENAVRYHKLLCKLSP